MPGLNRRKLLRATAGFAVGGLCVPAAMAQRLDAIDLAAIRGSLDATQKGLVPGALDDQSRRFTAMLKRRAMPIRRSFSRRETISSPMSPCRPAFGSPACAGATRIVYAGDGHLFAGDGTTHLELVGLTLDGANRWLGDHAQSLLDLRGAAHATIERCRVIGSTKSAIVLESSTATLRQNEITGAAEHGLYAVQSRRLSVLDNLVADCGNGGILVHRWERGEDGAIITGNRVERIAAGRGGTGQHGNGINLFRAGSVIVSGNRVSDCAFSAIRANGADNVQISGNTCLRSGETAIYSEFEFEGAVVSANVVDAAANGISIVN